MDWRKSRPKLRPTPRQSLRIFLPQHCNCRKISRTRFTLNGRTERENRMIRADRRSSSSISNRIRTVMPSCKSLASKTAWHLRQRRSVASRVGEAERTDAKTERSKSEWQDGVPGVRSTRSERTCIKQRTRLKHLHNTTLSDCEQVFPFYNVSDDDNVYNNNANVNCSTNM